jgi:hypothetical protein
MEPADATPALLLVVYSSILRQSALLQPTTLERLRLPEREAQTRQLGQVDVRRHRVMSPERWWIFPEGASFSPIEPDVPVVSCPPNGCH